MSNLRIIKDRTASGAMRTVTIVALAFVLVMGWGLYRKSAPILSEIPLWDLLTDSTWQPFKNKFGFFPFVMGTIWVTLIAVVIALPLSLFTAVFLTEYARRWVKKCVYPALDILASLPSVIYGVWGTLVIVPWISDRLAPYFVSFSSGYTTLAAGIVLSIMILPLLVSLFVELFSSVGNDLRDSAKRCSAQIDAWRFRVGGASRFKGVGRDHCRADGVRKYGRRAAFGLRRVLPNPRAHCQQLRRDAVAADVRVGADVRRAAAFRGGAGVQPCFAIGFEKDRKKVIDS